MSFVSALVPPASSLQGVTQSGPVDAAHVVGLHQC